MATVVMEDASGNEVAKVLQADIRHDPESGAFRVSGKPVPSAGSDERQEGSGVTVVLEDTNGSAVETLTDAFCRHDADTGAFCISGRSETQTEEEGKEDVKDGDLYDLLTIVVTTSPARSNPSLEMMETVVSSFRLIPGLSCCRLMIVCDGCNVGKKHRPSRGIVSEDAAERYQQFIDALRVASTTSEDSVDKGPLSGATILIQPCREGFGFAVKRALESVETPFVMVVHHDQRFRKAFDLRGILNTMRERPSEFNYCGVLSPGTINYAQKCAGKGLPNPDLAAEPLGSGKLVPLFVWYDRNHVASVEFYRENVISSGLVKRGTFIEDCYGQEQLKRIKAGGLDAWKKYGTWFFDDLTGDSMIHHLDGRRFMTKSQRTELGLPQLSH